MKHYRKHLLTSVMVMSMALVAFSQNDRQARKERIEAAKIGMITTQLNLTSEQATQFWPLYNEYNAKQEEGRKAMKKLKTSEPETDSDYKKILDEMMKHREKELALEKEYQDKFLKVITPRQMVQLIKTEREFKMKLLHMLEGRKPPHAKGDRGHGPNAPGDRGRGPNAPRPPR